MNSILFCLLFLSSLFFSKPVSRIPLRTAHDNSRQKATTFLSAHQSESLGLYNNNPFILELINGGYAYYLGLSLYSSDILLAGSCGVFPETFDCGANPYCTKGTTKKENFSSVYFTAASYTPLTFSYDFSLDNFWTSSYSSIKQVSSCTGQPYLNTGDYILGTVGFGLGANGNQAYNFEDVTSFTISLTAETYGEMVFGSDSDLIRGEAITYSTNNEWVGSWYVLELGTYGYQISAQNVLIMDLNSPYIVVPSEFYEEVIEQLYTLGMVCNSSSYDSNNIGQYCYSDNGVSIESLPNFNIQFTSGDSFTLNASTYISSNYGDNYLLIVPSSNILNNPGHYYVTSKYREAVIIGQPAFWTYNVKFDFSDTSYPTVTFYNQSASRDSFQGIPVDEFLLIWVGCAVLILIIIFSYICCCCCKDPKKGVKKNATPKFGKKTNAVAQQGVGANYQTLNGVFDPYAVHSNYYQAPVHSNYVAQQPQQIQQIPNPYIQGGYVQPQQYAPRAPVVNQNTGRVNPYPQF